MCPTSDALRQGWRPVVASPGYEVHYDGRVRNARTGRVLKPQQAKSGRYAKLHLGKRQAQVHQIVAEAWCPRPDCGLTLVVDHIDNTGTRNVATNLRWLTYSGNTRAWYAWQRRLTDEGERAGEHHTLAVPDDEWDTTYTRLTAAGL